MRRDWDADDLTEHWALSPSEKKLTVHKNGPTRLGFAVLLKFFRVEPRFPRDPNEIPRVAVEFVAEQVEVAPEEWSRSDWRGRTVKYHRAQIRTLLGFREATVADGEDLVGWLCDHVLVHANRPDHLIDAALGRCRALRIEPPTPERIERLVRSAVHAYEPRFCDAIQRRLPPETQALLEALMLPSNTAPKGSEHEARPGPTHAVFRELQADPGRPGLEAVLEGIAKLERVRALRLPPDLFDHVSSQVLRSYRRRVAVEEPHELRRHPRPLRMTLLAAYCFLRGRELTDNLVDLLVQTVHRIGARAERTVGRELLEDLKRVAGKHGLVFQLADAALTHPDGVVKEVV